MNELYQNVTATDDGLDQCRIAILDALDKTEKGGIANSIQNCVLVFENDPLFAGKISRIHRGLKVTSVIGCVYCALAMAVIWFLGRTLLSLFIDGETDPAVMDMAQTYIRLNGAFYIPLLFVNIVRLSVQGMGFTRIAMLAGVFEMAARTAVALFVVPVLGFTGACVANPAAWIMADIFLFPCYFRCIRALRERLQVPAVSEAA